MNEYEYYKVRESYCLAYDKAKRAETAAWKAYYFKNNQSKLPAWNKARKNAKDALEAFLSSCNHYNETYGFNVSLT
jgi:hypothetical protein